MESKVDLELKMNAYYQTVYYERITIYIQKIQDEPDCAEHYIDYIYYLFQQTTSDSSSKVFLFLIIQYFQQVQIEKCFSVCTKGLAQFPNNEILLYMYCQLLNNV